MALKHWLQLSLTDGIGPIMASRLIAAAGSAEMAAVADIGLLQSIEGIGQVKARQVRDAMRKAAGDVEQELTEAAEMGIAIFCQEDTGYPPLLRTIPDPPLVLYVKGNFESRDLNAVAIVGSRKCSFYGREQADRFAGLLASAGVTVISGGARGIDSAAHRGAIASPQGRTIAVLGCGVDEIYPPENGDLFDQIAQRGAVVSEFPLGTPPLRENFPRRNRIISGMSRGVLVIEADEKSGALITARQAADDHGRAVFALPGRVDNPVSAGPHALIRDGAVLTTNLEDILDNLGPLPAIVAEALPESLPAEPSSSDAGPRPVVNLTARQQALIDAMDSDPVDVDTLIGRTDLSAAVVLQELTLLSLRGAVERVDGQKFARRG
ncbi:MAG TPA: DNA-processing protein DprA [Tepidisphaeraceae bacterium]|nr:DNA-processing protein DprA [Tepidisphaeraceae bacterium]